MEEGAETGSRHSQGWHVGFLLRLFFEKNKTRYCMHGFGVLWFCFDTIPSIWHVGGVCGHMHMSSGGGFTSSLDTTT